MFLLALVAALFGVALRNTLVRAERTRAGFDAPAAPGSLKAQLLERGCARVAVLPMLDYTNLSTYSLKESRDDATLALCEISPNTTVSYGWANEVRVVSNTDIIVERAGHERVFQFHLTPRGDVEEDSPSTRVFPHFRRDPPWYAPLVALAWRGWQFLAYR